MNAIHGHAGQRPHSVSLALAHAALQDLNVPVIVGIVYSGCSSSGQWRPIIAVVVVTCSIQYQQRYYTTAVHIHMHA